MYEYIPIEDTHHVYRILKYIYHINEEVSYSKCHFSHSGSCTRISCLHILEINENYIKSPKIFFWSVREM